ncbi:glycosyltransferase [Vibrio pelagius]|uniref:glycosyltransferase n=1 Tax=Vibrio pelagius TaxID=28169 RepID=UPI00354D0A22
MNKIVMLLPNLAGGGAERVNLDLAYEFKSKGYQVDIVLCNAKGDFLQEAADNFHITDLQLKSIIQLPFKLTQYINSENPDAIIVSMWGLTAFAPFIKLLSKNTPSILLVEHNSLINQFKSSRLSIRIFLRISTFISYRLADHIGGVSLGVTNDMRKLACIKKNSAIEVLYNPIPSKTSIKINSQKIDFWEGCDHKILNVGSFKEQKNQKLLIEAFYLIKDKIDAKLIILGQGKLEQELKDLVNELDLESRVCFPGFIESPEQYFQNADLFVLSSDREGFGNVIVESLSCGTPVVSTNCEHGPSEILKQGEFGYLVPVGDSVALSEAILKSLTSEHDKNKLINRSKDFLPEKAAKRYLDLLGFE